MVCMVSVMMKNSAVKNEVCRSEMWFATLQLIMALEVKPNGLMEVVVDRWWWSGGKGQLGA